MTWIKRLAAAVGVVALAGAGLLATTTTVLAWTIPPVLTPVCTSSAATYTFAVSGSENDYNVTVDQSASSSFASPVTVSHFTSATQPYDFGVSQSNGKYVKAEWTTDDSAGFGTTVTGNAGCSTPTTTATQVKDASGAVSSPVALGVPVWDTAIVGGEANGIVPTGTVTYSFFDNGSCTTPAASTQAVTLSYGVVPNSASETLTAGGSYSFDAVYSGDSKYSGSPSSCEPFSVATGAVGGARTTTTATPTTGAVSAASTLTAPTTGADLFLSGLLAAFASLFGGLLLMAGVRLRRRPTV